MSETTNSSGPHVTAVCIPSKYKNRSTIPKGGTTNSTPNPNSVILNIATPAPLPVLAPTENSATFVPTITALPVLAPTENSASTTATFVPTIIAPTLSSNAENNPSDIEIEQSSGLDVSFHITISGTDFLALVDFVKMFNKGTTHYNFFNISHKGLTYEGTDVSNTTKALVTIFRHKVVSFYLDKEVKNYPFCFSLDTVTANTRHFKTQQVTLGKSKGNNKIYITLPNQGDKNLFYLDLINASPSRITYPSYNIGDDSPTVVVWAPELNKPCKNITTKQKASFSGFTNAIIVVIANPDNKGGGVAAWRFGKIQNDNNDGEQICGGLITGSVIKLVSKFCALAPPGNIQIFLEANKAVKFVSDMGHCGKAELYVNITITPA